MPVAAAGMSTRELAPEATSSPGAFRYLWSASLISAVAVTGRLPWLALALFGGVIVDRLDRHRLMLWTRAGQMLVVTLIRRIKPPPRAVPAAPRRAVLAYGATPLGALVGGFVASEYGLIAPWLVGGVLSLLVAVVSLPSLWRWAS